VTHSFGDNLFLWTPGYTVQLAKSPLLFSSTLFFDFTGSKMNKRFRIRVYLFGFSEWHPVRKAENW
jgi:hypothetical protein